MSKLDLLLEADRRGLLDDANRALLDEARRRGLVPSADGKTAPKADTELSWSDVPGQALSNLGESAVNFGKSVVAPFLDPVGTVQGLYDVGKGVASKAAGLVVEQDPKQKAETEAAADAVGQYFADRYGGLENLKKTIATDPVGVLADGSIVLTGGGSLAARGPGVVARAGNVARRAGNAIDPLQNVGRAVNATGTVAQHVLGQTTGAGSVPMRLAYDAGRQGGNVAFTDAMRGHAPVSDVVDMAENAVNNLTRERGAAYRANMANTLADQTALNVQPINTAVADAMQSVTYQGQAVNQEAVQALRRVDRTIQRFSSLPNNAGNVAAGLDAMKKAVGGIMERYKPGTQPYRVVKQVYDEIGNQIRAQVPDYDDAMRAYSQASDQLTDLRRTFSINPNAAADTTARKLLSVTRNNVNTNYGERARLFDVLSHQPGAENLPYAVAGHALSSATPRGLQGVAATGTGATALMTNPKALATLPFFSPRLMGEATYAAGLTANQIEALARRMRMSPERVRQILMTSYATDTVANAEDEPEGRADGGRVDGAPRMDSKYRRAYIKQGLAQGRTYGDLMRELHAPGRRLADGGPVMADYSESVVMTEQPRIKVRDKRNKIRAYTSRGMEPPPELLAAEEDMTQTAESRGAQTLFPLGAVSAIPAGPVLGAAGQAIRFAGAPALAGAGYFAATSSAADAEADAPQIDYKTIFVQPPRPPARIVPDQIGDDEVDNFIKAQGGVQRAQQQLGIAADGKAGSGTRAAIKRALADQRTGVLQKEFEQQQSTWADRNTAAKLKFQSDQSNLPFVERNEWWRDYVVPGSYVAAAAAPAGIRYLIERAGKAPQRMAARAVDDAVQAYGRNPNPLNAKTAGRAAKDFKEKSVPTAAASAPSTAADLAKAAVPHWTVATGAGLPALAVGVPLGWDYTQSPVGSRAQEEAAEQLTVEGLMKRFLGPGATGLGLAAMGSTVGRGLAAASNPMPRGANLARAQSIGAMADDPSQMARGLTPVRPETPGIAQRAIDATIGSPTYRANRAADASAARARRTIERTREEEARLIADKVSESRRQNALDAQRADDALLQGVTPNTGSTSSASNTVQSSQKGQPPLTGATPNPQPPKPPRSKKKAQLPPANPNNLPSSLDENKMLSAFDGTQALYKEQGKSYADVVMNDPAKYINSVVARQLNVKPKDVTPAQFAEGLDLFERWKSTRGFAQGGAVARANRAMSRHWEKQNRYARGGTVHRRGMFKKGLRDC